MDTAAKLLNRRGVSEEYMEAKIIILKGGSEEYMEALRLNESLNNEITGLKTLIQTHPAAHSSQG